MKFIVEESLSPEIKDYLNSLRIKTEYGKYFNCKNIGRIVIEEETGTLLFCSICYMEYPSLFLEYYLIYKRERIIIEIESFNFFEHRLISLRIPEILWEEKKELLNLGIEMIYWFKKTEGPKSLLISLDITRDKFHMNTDNIRYYREKLENSNNYGTEESPV